MLISINLRRWKQHRIWVILRPGYFKTRHTSVNDMISWDESTFVRLFFLEFFHRVFIAQNTDLVDESHRSSGWQCQAPQNGESPEAKGPDAFYM